MAMDSKQNQVIDFVPVIRSGEWSDIGCRKYMEDTHVCISDLAKKYGSPSLEHEAVSFYGVSLYSSCYIGQLLSNVISP